MVAEDIEARIRILVADQLGVDVHDLAHDVSLVDDRAALKAARERGEPWDPRVTLRVRITDAGARDGWYLERTLALSPYAVETIADDARSAGPGTRVELTLPASVEREAIDWLDERVAPLRRRGIAVDVRPPRASKALLTREAARGA